MGRPPLGNQRQSELQGMPPMPSLRPSGRQPDEMRRVSLEPGVLKHAEGSCLVTFGDTKVLCSASVENAPPPFLRGSGRGWVTAEYGMLPRATTDRTRREAARSEERRVGKECRSRWSPYQ